MKMLWAALIIGAALFLWVTRSGGGERFRYRVTVEVETPDGVRSGHSVHEVRAAYQNNLYLAPRSRNMDMTGEAVAVDLPNGKTLFMLPPSSEKVQQVFDAEWKNDWVESTKRISDRKTSGVLNFPIDTKRERGSDGLPQSHDGLFVQFRDINKPATVEEVNPEHLPEAFGTGYALRRVTVQLTDEPLTSGIERRLPWLPDYYNFKFSGDRYSSLENAHKGISAFMSSGAFSAGLGLNPISEGQTLRLPIPDLTEERRKELAKLAGQYSEKAKVAVRNVRRDSMDALKTDEKKNEISEDERKRLEAEVQKLTDETVAELDAAAAAKEKEILQK
jgi:hypothetical protein